MQVFGVEDGIERLFAQLAIFDLLRVVDENALGRLHQRRDAANLLGAGIAAADLCLICRHGIQAHQHAAGHEHGGNAKASHTHRLSPPKKLQFAAGSVRSGCNLMQPVCRDRDAV